MYKCCSLDSSPPSRRVLLVGRSHTMHAPSRGEAPPHTPATTSWMELVAELKVFIPRAIDELQLTHDSHAANLSSWAAALQSTDAEEYLHKFPSVRTKDKALYQYKWGSFHSIVTTRSVELLVVEGLLLAEVSAFGAGSRLHHPPEAPRSRQVCLDPP